jgi:hypothetical protein
VINDLQPADVAARRKSMPGRRSFGRLEARLTANIHARRPADANRSLLKASLELGGITLFLYAARAAIGFGVGLVPPWLFYFGVLHR